MKPFGAACQIVTQAGRLDVPPLFNMCTLIRFIKTQASYYILAKYVKCFVFCAILVLKWVDISPIVV